MKNFKVIGIFVGIILAIGLLITMMFASTNNKAIRLEEQINGANSEIEVQEKRRVDLIYNLVDTVEAYAQHEKETLAAVTEMRADAKNGNIQEVQMSLNAVAEAYPELKANTNYNQLMTELSVTENLIAQSRNNYNQQVKAYNKFTRSFPANIILNTMGYEKVEFDYTEYEAPSDAPQNLFD